MIVGYARVSRFVQDLEVQIQALTAAGCTKIYQETISGARKRTRPQFKTMLQELQPGDCIIVYRLDRLGRNLLELVETRELLQKLNINFVSLTEAIDIRTISGKLIFNVLGAVAEYERDAIEERTRARLQILKAKGVKLGKKPTERGKKALQLINEGKNFSTVHAQTNISEAQYYRLKASIN